MTAATLETPPWYARWTNRARGGPMSGRAWALLAAVSLVWGIPYFLIKLAVDDGVPPAFLAWIRIAVGAVALLAVVPRRGALRALRGRLRWVCAFAIAEVVVPFPLIAIGEQHVSSSLAAILIAAAPLFVALLALRFDASERVRGRRLAGLVIGMVGVIALVGIDVAGRLDELLGALAILVAALCYAIGPMVLKRHLADLDARVTMAASLVIASVLLAPAAAAHPPAALPSLATCGALLVLGTLCTAAGLVLYGRLVSEVGAGRALVVTYINPVVAVGLGSLLLAERPGPGMLVGLALILGGSWLSTARQTAAAAR